MGRFIGTNRAILDFTSNEAVLALARMGALPPYGSGNIRIVTASTNLAIPPWVKRARVRCLGAGAALAANGGDTAFGAVLLAGGGRARSGATPGAGGTTATGALRAAGGPGGAPFASSPSSNLGGGGGAGSQLGDGMAGAAFVEGGPIASGGGVSGVTAKVGVWSGGELTVPSAPGRAFGDYARIGYMLEDLLLAPRFPGDHFGDGFDNAKLQTVGAALPYDGAPVVSVPAFGTGGYNWGVLGAAAPTAFGGADAQATSSTRKPTFGGGAASGGGGAWCCDELALTGGTTVSCTIGTSAEGGSGLIVVEFEQ